MSYRWNKRIRYCTPCYYLSSRGVDSHVSCSMFEVQFPWSRCVGYINQCKFTTQYSVNVLSLLVLLNLYYISILILQSIASLPLFSNYWVYEHNSFCYVPCQQSVILSKFAFKSFQQSCWKFRAWSWGIVLFSWTWFQGNLVFVCSQLIPCLQLMIVTVPVRFVSDEILCNLPFSSDIADIVCLSNHVSGTRPSNISRGQDPQISFSSKTVSLLWPKCSDFSQIHWFYTPQ